MEIRTADTADVDAVADLWVALAQGQREFGSHLLAEQNRAYVREMLTRHAVTGGLLVAIAEDVTRDGPAVSSSASAGDDSGPERADPAADPVGFVMFSLETGDYQQDVTRGTVQNLYVDPAFRGEGIGSALLKAAESALADTGAEVVSLEAMARNSRARQFYQRAGYEPHRIEFEKRVESDTDTNGAE